MSDPSLHQEGAPAPADRASGAIRYPTNHVVAIIDAAGQLSSAVTALTGAGFLQSEVEVSCGKAAADRLRASTGHTGLTGLAIRFAERLGMANHEMEMKNQYEQALRDGHCVVAVLAPTEERKELAVRTLREHGGQFINFLQRFTIEAL